MIKSDEDQIRDRVGIGMQATKVRDVDAVLELMTDDAVFLVPGRAPMRKGDFASAAKAQAGTSAPAFEGFVPRRWLGAIVGHNKGTIRCLGT